MQECSVPDMLLTNKRSDSKLSSFLLMPCAISGGFYSLLAHLVTSGQQLNCMAFLGDANPNVHIYQTHQNKDTTKPLVPPTSMACDRCHSMKIQVPVDNLLDNRILFCS